jgi:hypothetical protein
MPFEPVTAVTVTEVPPLCVALAVADTAHDDGVIPVAEIVYTPVVEFPTVVPRSVPT